MLRRFFLFLLVLGLIFSFSSVSLAQVDDDDSGEFNDSMVEFITPDALLPSQEFEFSLSVSYGGGAKKAMKSEWINQVDMTLPSSDYSVNTGNLEAPDPIHGTGDPYEIDRWEVNFDPGSSSLSWQCFSVVTSESYGDIREGDSQIFSFAATTDTEATDGFTWTLYGDEGSMLSDVIYIGQGDDDDTTDDDTVDDDDDDNDTDDDDKAADDDADDDEDVGCGC